MYRASDQVSEEVWLDRLEAAADDLDLAARTRAAAADLYLSALPLPDRSRPPTLAASCYTAALITGDERSQTAVAEAFGVSRLSIQSRWKEQLEAAGLTAPGW